MMSTEIGLYEIMAQGLQKYKMLSKSRGFKGWKIERMRVNIYCDVNKFVSFLTPSHHLIGTSSS